MDKTNANNLKRGWTTGACATAAVKAAFAALLKGEFPDPVSIRLPKGQTPAFALALEGKGDGWARAGIIKDAGDDPDVTHGCLVVATVWRTKKPGIEFVAGEGVGQVTLPGLPVEVGEPAINPVPRQMIKQVVEEFAVSGGARIEISIPDGEQLAKKTFNPRLGIVGGLSILGTTGIVNPFSCSAWIASIHSAIDVARMAGLTHLVGSTGSTSEEAAQQLFGLDDLAMIDMGDFAGGLLKYLRRNPVERVTIAGGMAKMTKLAQGALDLHSGRSQVDFDWLSGLVADKQLRQRIIKANTVLEVVSMDCVDIAGQVGELALATARKVLRDAPVKLDILVLDRNGRVMAHAR